MKIAALQMQSVVGDFDANLAQIEKAAIDAASAGARLLIAPELAIVGYGAGEAFSKLSSPAGGDAEAGLSAIAARNHIAIVAGFAERDGDAIYNSALFVDDMGKVSVYRKSHLYGDYEKRWFHPETPKTVLVEIDGIRFGMLICYDVEFPENVRRLALAGADLVVVPTALPKGTSGDFIASTMIRTRAFENQVFLAYVNHHGSDGAFDYAGQSAIAAPDGAFLAQAPGSGDALLFGEIDPQAYAASRADNSYLSDLG
jgi:predicted amidohydrolase